MPTCPGNQGGTNWYSPSYSPRTGLFYLSAWENYASIFRRRRTRHTSPGRTFTRRRVHRAHAGAGARRRSALAGGGRSTTGPTRSAAARSSRSIPKTGKRVWKFRAVRRDRRRHPDDGVRPAVHRRPRRLLPRARRADRQVLWKASLGGPIVMAPITYQVDGKQYVSVISGNTLVTFGLRN